MRAAQYIARILHCFQKKSTRGVRTAKTGVELIERRLEAELDTKMFLTALGSDIEIRIRLHAGRRSGN